MGITLTIFHYTEGSYIVSCRIRILISCHYTIFHYIRLIRRYFHIIVSLYDNFNHHCICPPNMVGDLFGVVNGGGILYLSLTLRHRIIGLSCEVNEGHTRTIVRDVFVSEMN